MVEEREERGRGILESRRPRPTGSMIVAMRQDMETKDAVSLLQDRTGVPVASKALAQSDNYQILADSEVEYLEDFGVAFVSQATRQANKTLAQALMAEDLVEEVRPEFFLFKQQEFVDTESSTWGVAATRALDSPFTGKGVKICILDTGIDLGHPDFVHRGVTSQSFVDGEDVSDLQGHGTHCAGIAAGRSVRPNIPRFGIAPEASLFVGKILSNKGFGAERDILRGMQWAIDNQCDVISMSLGSVVAEGGKASVLYERIGRAALDKNCLVIAAAGNESSRDFGFIAPVDSPANASTIMAVGALDPKFKIAHFSNGGINGDGGEIDLVGPGVAIFSSVPAPRLFRTMSGTSMACPHVAGIAALWAETNPVLRGKQLWDVLIENARPLPHPKRDAGAGLVQAPLAAAIVAQAI